MKKYMVTLGLVCSAYISAAPSPYAKGLIGFKVDSPEAEVVPDHEFNTNKQVWVKPPKTGRVVVKSFSADVNDPFLKTRCSQAKTILDASASVTNQIKKATERADDYKHLLDAAIQKENIARELLGEVSARPETAKLLAAKREIDDTNNLLTEVGEELNECKQGCSELSVRYTDLLQTLRDNQSIYRELRKENKVIAREFEKAERRLEQAQGVVDSYSAPYAQRISKLIALRAEFMEMFSVDAVTEGGWAAIDYETRWEEVIASLQAKYPEFNFKPISTYNVDLNFHLDFVKNENYLSSMPSVLDYNVSGMPRVAKGDIEVELDAFGDKKVKHTKSAIHALVSGDFRMSLLSTCGKLDKYFYDGLDDQPELDDLNFHKFGFSVNYQYESKFDFDFSMTYNTSKIYTLIKKHKKKRRFFSSKSAASVIEDTRKNSTIEFHWDPGSSYNTDDRATVEVKMRKEVVARILDSLATRVAPAKMPDAGPAPETGAMVLANGINDTCGKINIYCKAAGWMFKSLNSMFGSSTVENTYVNRTNFTATEKMNGSEYFWLSDSVSFQR